VNSQTKSRYRPVVDSLETRALLSALTAHLRHGVLTVSRDEASVPIQVDVQTLTAQRRGRAHHGTVLVHGVGGFDLRRVKSITIKAGPSAANITIREPSGFPLPIRVIATPAPIPPPTLAVPAPPSSVSVPGVTGVQSILEQQIFDLANAQRIQAGLAPLTVNAKLVTAAQIHARDMAALGLMQHDLPGVAQPTLVSRAQFVGYSYGWLGENIASDYADAPSVVAAWMASPEHRANILNPNLKEAGLGVGRDTQGNLYFCEDFASPA
jgi:uncharacterized protein YkwD